VEGCGDAVVPIMLFARVAAGSLVRAAVEGGLSQGLHNLAH